jgi:hypothetical protein
VLIEEALPDLTLRAIRFQTAADLLHVLERPELPLASLMAEVDRLMPVLLVVDTIHRFASAERHAARSRATDASTSEAWAPIMEALDRIARRSNAAVVLSAQAVKATGEYRDSSEIGHGVDVVLNLIRPDKDSAVRRLEKDKARFPYETLTFELRGDTYQRGGTVTRKLSKQRQKVLDALEPPMSFTEWESATEVPHSTFARALKHLSEQGYVHRSAEDTYHLVPVGPQGQTGTEPRLVPPLSRSLGARGGTSAGPETNWESDGVPPPF